VLGSKRGGLLSTILLLGPQQTEPSFLPLRNRCLRDKTAKDELASAIQPMARKRVDHLAPHPPLELVEICRRLRTTLTRDAGNDGKRSCGFAGHLKRPLDGSS
jgi:hypothetical protein